MDKIGLILEGGGMRGIYTAGVLDFFINKNIEVDLVVGVSAGGCHAASYLSKQYNRAFKTNIDYIDHKDYISFKNLIKNGSIFGMDLIFNKIPNELYPYDYETFNNSKSNFTVVTTNCETGEAEYFRLNDMKKDIMYLQASCSIPMFTNIVEIDGLKLVDGGVSDSIPIEYAIKQGCNKNIVILTRDETYVKNKVKFLPFVKRKYKKYPKLVKSIENRHLKYNKTLNLIKSLEEKNEVFVIRPKSPVKVSQVEKNKDKLIDLYNDGYNDAKNSYEKILEYINK